MPGPERGGARSRDQLLVLLAVFAVFAATMSTFSIDADPSASDVPSYVPMAEAAPGLPDEDLGSAYTGRFSTHYAVGMLAWATPLSVEGAYTVAFAAVVGALLLLAHVLLRPLPLGTYALCVALLVLNPYFLRVAAVKMATLQDLVLVLGVAVALLGLLRVRPWVVLAGLLVAICGRQTALLVAPAAALWMLLAPGWRDLPAARRAGFAAAGVALTGAAYGAVQAIVAPFTTPFSPGIPGDTLLARVDELPGFAGDLAEHVARTAVPLLEVIVVLAVLIAAIGPRRVHASVWWLLLVAAVIVVQPLALDPDFPGLAHNEQRLSGLALFALVVACGIAAAQAGLAFGGVGLAAAAALLVVGSLHGTYSAFGPESDAVFLVVQVVVAAGVGALAWRAARAEPARA